MARETETHHLNHNIGCKLLDALGIPKGIEVTRIELVVDWDEAVPKLRIDSVVLDAQQTMSQLFDVFQAPDGGLYVEPTGEIKTGPMPKGEPAQLPDMTLAPQFTTYGDKPY